MQTVEIKLLEFNTAFYQVDTAKYVESDCNSITFINYGTSVAYIENIQLQPNQSFEIPGSSGEYTKQRFYVRFSTGVGLVNNLTVVLKRYVNVSE